MKTIIFFALLGMFSAAVSAQEPAAPVKATEAATAAKAPEAAVKTKAQQLNEAKDEIRAQYELDLQKAKIAKLEADYNNLALENKFAGEKAVAEMARLKAELDKASAENKLAEEKGKAAAAAQTAELQKIVTENKLADENAKKALADLSGQLARLKAANDLLTERQREQSMADAKEKSVMEMEAKRMDFKERQLKFEKTLMESRMDKLGSDLTMRTKKEEWKKEANSEPVYIDKPFSDGRLVVSDRRIALNGPIYSGSADHVTDRIHYFNNISSAPIFIMIDSSPGGSVMAGYRILKAMQASRAPVYVAVKSFAASMAAVITTLAEKSYVYPNAIILHHQMSTMNWGNMTQLKEQLEMAREWERRLMLPVAKKMGIPMEEFRKKMYEKNSDGDWEEFGDKAVENKWATSLVERIEETGLVKNPDYEAPAANKRALDEREDDKGQRYTALPRLQPFDFYFIYNPDKYYR
ncbi:MAG TPA: ATP-dependent Clp protease proteolytic subunit [Elusimicrobiales bacterium]|nr:ATP-dependent Clp protease proteolytic subunit [Elusimicrobiales bacterium]